MDHQIVPGYTSVAGHPGFYTHDITRELAQIRPSQYAQQRSFAQQSPLQFSIPQYDAPALNNTWSGHEQPLQNRQFGHQANFTSPYQNGPYYSRRAAMVQQQPQYAPGPFESFQQQQQSIMHARQISQPFGYGQDAFNALAPPQTPFSQVPDIAMGQYTRFQAAPIRQPGAIKTPVVVDLTQDDDEPQGNPTTEIPNRVTAVPPKKAISTPEQVFSREDRRNLNERVAYLETKIQNGSDPVAFRLLNTFKLTLTDKRKLKYCTNYWPDNETAEKDIKEIAKFSPNFSVIYVYRLSWTAGERLTDVKELEIAKAEIEKEKEELRRTCHGKLLEMLDNENAAQDSNLIMGRRGSKKREERANELQKLRDIREREKRKREVETARRKQQKEEEALEKEQQRSEAALQKQAREEEKRKRKAEEPPKKRGRPRKRARTEEFDLMDAFAADSAFGPSVYQNAPTPSSPPPTSPEIEAPNTSGTALDDLLAGHGYGCDASPTLPENTASLSSHVQDEGDDLDAPGETDHEADFDDLFIETALPSA